MHGRAEMVGCIVGGGGNGGRRVVYGVGGSVEGVRSRGEV